MLNATDKIILDLLAAWHEAGRANHARIHSNADNYDRLNAKSAKQGRAYINLDDGTSGVFMVERATGYVYSIKGYGKIDKRKFAGTVANLMAKYREAVS